MDTAKFELTDEIQSILIGSPHQDSPEKLAREIAAKVLSLFEPVELEALGDEEIKEVIYSQKRRRSGWTTIIMPRDKLITQATCQKNQKGQLYRVKE